MAPTGPAAAQAKRKGRRKKGKRRKSGSGDGKAAAAAAGPAATAAAAAAAQRSEEEEKEQRARMIQLAKEYLQLWGMRVRVVVDYVCMVDRDGSDPILARRALTRMTVRRPTYLTTARHRSRAAGGGSIKCGRRGC